MKSKKFTNPKLFINRELSWLKFNSRVLGEAKNNKIPLFERLKFLSIVSSNLDEFFMIRVGSLRAQINEGYNEPDASGMIPRVQLDHIYKEVADLVTDQYNCLTYSIYPSLKKEGFSFADKSSLTELQLNSLNEYFYNQIYPVLTTMAFDKSRPFPLILNRSLNLAVLLKGSNDETLFATVQVPSVLPRFIELKSTESVIELILLEDIIKMNINDLFKGYKVLAVNTYRITRNADFTLNENDADDMLEEMINSLKKRKWGATVRLEIESRFNEQILDLLTEKLNIEPDSIYKIKGPVDLTYLSKFISSYERPHLRNVEYNPVYPEIFQKDEDFFSLIRDQDILVHHPYDDFKCVVDFIEKAADDPDVLAIKQTLYRISNNSPIMKALIRAVENGKQVTVLFEIKARFDEENNIQWAKKLEEAGGHVNYGLVGLKTHCKATLIVRKENDGIIRYIHLGTGNYNEITAGLYTDVGLFTADKDMGADISALFNNLTGYCEPPDWQVISASPLSLRKKITELIKNEMKISSAERPGRIIMKINSLVDKDIISHLYKASCNGVEIDLIVRGMCCLRPGITGISKNIRVISIIDRYLEHSRIFYFHNGGREEIFLSSADMMERNLDRRVEIMFPVRNKKSKDRLKNILDTHLNDNVKARELKSDGQYVKINLRGKDPFHSQVYFHKPKVW